MSIPQYSLRSGTMSVPRLIEEAISRGVTQMVLSDINNSTGVMEFIRGFREAGVKPIGGLEFRRDKKLLYIGIARNKEGMRSQRCRFVDLGQALRKSGLPVCKEVDGITQRIGAT